MLAREAAESFLMAKPNIATTPRHGATRSSGALDNLRGVVILIVLGFHSALAYVSWVAPNTANFDDPPYHWRAFPIVDPHRFFGFDLFCAWQDVYLMSLLFFLSGLFVWPSLTRKGVWVFVRDRALRLGVPFVFGIIFVIPLAVYPAYSLTTDDPTFAGYMEALRELPFWPNGPLWFLWQLLALNIVAALLHAIAPNALGAFGRLSTVARERVGLTVLALIGASALAYVPLALAFTPWSWSNVGVLAVQWCRPLHYAVYFFAGIAVGAAGLDRSLVAVTGPLPRRWALWLVGALISLVVWMGVTSLTLGGDAPVGTEVAAHLSYVVACAAGCFFLIAVTLRFAPNRSPVLGGLGANAYPLYLLHYVFVVWLQYALLSTPLFAVVKAAIVFGVTLFGTWFAAEAVQRVPFGARLIGSTRRAVAGLAP